MARQDHGRLCRGPNRRELLKVGALSLFGLGLDDLFRHRAIASDPYGTKTLPVRAQSCILIWQAGGPSHIDTLDPKPDAAKEFRGEFQPIATSVPGVSISEVYPNIARAMDRITLIRSMTSPEAEHDRAAHHLLTGYRPSPALVYPSYGSVVTKARGQSSSSVLPPYVAVPDAPIFSSSGYLTPAYDPFAVGGDPSTAGFRVRDLTPPDRLTLERLNSRRSMVKALDDFSKDVPDTPLTTSRDKFDDQAYDLLTSGEAQSAFRIEDEPASTRDRFGRNPVGQACLLARRLVERGVSFVTINDRGAGALGWDTHAQNFPTIKNTLAPPVDVGFSTLIADLAERGLLETTLVIMMGEFGRTPKINPNAGRDHHGRANSLLLAGGGTPGGLVIGKTDARGDSPEDRPITPGDLASTLYTSLGIDPARQFQTPDGQPIRLVDKPRPIRELL